MKRQFTLLAILALVLFAFIGNARASYEVLQLSNASDQTVHAPAKIARVEIVSSTATGKATVKRVSPVTTVGSHIDTYTKTTYTYTTVYSNGVNVVTNTSPYITRHFRHATDLLHDERRRQHLRDHQLGAGRDRRDHERGHGGDHLLRRLRRRFAERQVARPRR